MIPLIASIGIVPALPFAQAEVSMGCKGGEARLQDPNTGEIICEKQSKVSKFVNDGWIALDPVASQGKLNSLCKNALIPLQDPNDSKNIVCEKPHIAKKLVSEGWVPLHPPHKQLSNDVVPHEIVCRQMLKLVIRDSGHGNCVTPSTHDKMIAAGIGAKAMDKECTTGYIHLKNPNTGAIICDKPQLAKKLLNQGWIALDKIPGMEKTAPTVCKGGEAKLKDPNSDTIICENQDQAQKYINQGWILTNSLTTSVHPSDIIIGGTVHKHMATIETIGVTIEPPSDSNVYNITYRVTAGAQHLENIQITVVSDTDKASGMIDLLGARADATLQIRIHAIDAGSIHGMISNYHLK